MSIGLFEKSMATIQPGMKLFCSDGEKERCIFDDSFSRKKNPKKKTSIFYVWKLRVDFFHCW